MGAGAVAWALPAPPNIWLTLLLRGGVLTALYGLGLLSTGWVPEVSAVNNKVGWSKK